MPYYEFFIYGPSKARLAEVEDTLIKIWDFDPATANLRRSYKPWHFDWATRLCNLVGIRSKDDWLLTITGPKVNEHAVHTIAEAWGGFCDGGGYDLTYDPTGYYSDEAIERHTELYNVWSDEQHRRYMDSLPPEERERVEQAIRDLDAHIQAHENDEG